MYTTVIVIAIALIVVQYQLASLKQKISDLKTENEALKNSIKDENNKLSFTISDIEQSIEIIENNINRLKKEDIHEINDNIKDLKSWLRNVGQIYVQAQSPHQHEISSIHPWMINYSCAIPLSDTTMPALAKRLNSSFPTASRIAFMAALFAINLRSAAANASLLPPALTALVAS